MKRMVPLFNGVCHRLQDAIGQRVGYEPIELDMLAWTARTALELIGQAGLGYAFDPLTADAPSDFAKLVKSFG